LATEASWAAKSTAPKMISRGGGVDEQRRPVPVAQLAALVPDRLARQLERGGVQLGIPQRAVLDPVGAQKQLGAGLRAFEHRDQRRPSPLASQLREARLKPRRFLVELDPDRDLAAARQPHVPRL
jgi:hypothetical protein